MIKTYFADQTTGIDIRDYLIMTLFFTNCLLVSNLINITLHDVLDAKHKKKLKMCSIWQIINMIRYYSFMVKR